MVFWLRFKRRGTGTNLTDADIQDLDWSQIREDYDTLIDAWEKEKG